MKRNEYLANYWLLFLDFLKVFGGIRYKQIPLALLTNFYQLLDDSARREMSKKSFKDNFSIKLENSQIQPSFEQWISPLKQPPKKKALKGKVLLNFDYLRFTEDNYHRNFNKDQTMIFARWEQKEFLGIPVHSIKHYQVDVNNAVNKLLKKADKIFKTLKTHPIYGNQFFYDYFMKLIPQMVDIIAAVSNFYERTQVSCLIVGTTEDLISRVLTIMAGRRGIPSICMQHGLLGGDEAYLPVFTTKVAIYGEYEKKWYLDRGLEKNRMLTIGHPQFDDIFTQKHMTRAAFQEKYKLNPNKTILLFATQPNYVNMWNELMDQLAPLPQFEIIIKPHPWELSQKERARKLVENYQNYERKYKSVKFIIDKRMKLFDILPNVDFVVINLSTVGIEAMLFDKPLCILSDKPFAYYEKMSDYLYNSPQELAKFILEFLQNPGIQEQARKKRKEFLNYAYPARISGMLLKDEISRLIKEVNSGLIAP